MKNLKDFAGPGLKEKKLGNKIEYIEQLKKELEIIKENKFSQYFLTTKAIIDIAVEQMLIGPRKTVLVLVLWSHMF